MKKYLDIVLVGAMAAFGAGCSDSDSGGGGGTAGTGGTGGGGQCVIEIGVDTDEINEDTAWDRPECDYVLTRIVYVVTPDGASDPTTLTIAPGVTVKGDNNSALIISRGAEIIAEGTVDDPIVMTSSRAVGARDRGDWGGLALLGSALINRGLGTCDGTAGECEDALEGLEATEPRARFGGNEPSSSCGSLEYVRIEFAGFEIAPNNELNGLTVGGCGSGTNLDFIQVHRGLDDGVEFFGGEASISHVIVDGMGDDGIDWDQGYIGTIENFISHHYAGRTDDPRGIEADNFGTTTNIEPRSNPTVRYGTIVMNPGDPQVDQGVVLRRGTWGTLEGLVVEGYRQAGVDVRDDGWDDPTGGWPNDLSVSGSCFFGNDPNYPVDSDPCTGGDDDVDCNDESTQTPGTFFQEDQELPAMSLGNLVEDPQTGDYTTAASGGTPDYSVGNGNCMGAFATPMAGPAAAEGIGLKQAGGAGGDGGAGGAGGMGGDGGAGGGTPPSEDWTVGWTAFPVN